MSVRVEPSRSSRSNFFWGLHDVAHDGRDVDYAGIREEREAPQALTPDGAVYRRLRDGFELCGDVVAGIGIADHNDALAHSESAT
jgi:hypothetical protein